MSQNKPVGIKWISYFQLFGSIMLLFTIGVEQNPAFNVRFGVPFLPELFVKGFLIVCGAFVAYGYLQQTKWGFWSMLIYSILLCVTGLQVSVGTAVYPFVVVIYTLMHHKEFNILFKKK